MKVQRFSEDPDNRPPPLTNRPSYQILPQIRSKRARATPSRHSYQHLCSHSNFAMFQISIFVFCLVWGITLTAVALARRSSGWSWAKRSPLPLLVWFWCPLGGNSPVIEGLGPSV